MKKIFFASIATLLLFLSSTIALADWNPTDKAEEEMAMKDTITRFLQADPTLQYFFDKAAGYAVFPDVGKGAFIAGVGYGRGWLYEGGKPIGKSSILQLSAGAQIGGQIYSELIFFRDTQLVNDFKFSRFELGAQISAVAVTSGAGRASTYTNGIAVFILPKGGIMAEASVSGQRFAFEPFKE